MFSYCWNRFGFLENASSQAGVFKVTWELLGTFGKPSSSQFQGVETGIWDGSCTFIGKFRDHLNLLIL